MKRNDVKTVKYLEGYKLLITYNNNEQHIFDLEATEFFNRKLFQKLHDIEEFKKVKPFYNTIQWVGEIDICPDALYELSEPFQYKTEE